MVGMQSGQQPLLQLKNQCKAKRVAAEFLAVTGQAAGQSLAHPQPDGQRPGFSGAAQ